MLICVPLKIREVITKLEDAGWRNIRTKGDHRIFRHPDGQLQLSPADSVRMFDREPTRQCCVRLKLMKGANDQDVFFTHRK